MLYRYMLPITLTLYSIDTHFNASTAFENIEGKGEIAHNDTCIPICPFF